MSPGEGDEVKDAGVDFSKTESADETESVEISTDLLSAASLDDSKSPSTWSSGVSEVEIKSFDDEAGLDWVVAGSGSKVVAGVVVDEDTVAERTTELVETLCSKDEDGTAGEVVATDDSDVRSTTTSEEVLESDNLVTFSVDFAVSTAEVLFAVLVRDEMPDDVVLVVLDVVEATVEQVAPPWAPVVDRVVV